MKKPLADFLTKPHHKVGCVVKRKMRIQEVQEKSPLTHDVMKIGKPPNKKKEKEKKRMKKKNCGIKVQKKFFFSSNT